MDDKLSHEERVRLEALAQANHSTMGRADPSVIIEVAKAYEMYIRSGDNPYPAATAN